MENREAVYPQDRPETQPVQVGRPPARITEDLVKETEAQVQLRKRLKRAVLGATEERDWISVEGEPYPLDSAIQAMAQVAGVEFGPPAWTEDSGEDAGKPWRIFTCEITATWCGRSTTDIGTASTKDRFFSMRKGAPVPYEEIRIDLVKKKAITNAQHRALLKVMGLGSVSWETLKEYGVTRPQQSVRFKGGERQAVSGSGGWTDEKREIEGLLLELHNGEVEAAGQRLFDVSRELAKGYRGARDVRELPDNVVRIILPRLREEYRNTFGEEAPPAAPPAGQERRRQPGEEG